MTFRQVLGISFRVYREKVLKVGLREFAKEHTTVSGSSISAFENGEGSRHTIEYLCAAEKQAEGKITGRIYGLAVKLWQEHVDDNEDTSKHLVLHYAEKLI